MPKKKIHIVMLGETIDHAISGIQEIGCSELYPIVSKKFKPGEKHDSVALLKKSLGRMRIKIHKTIGDVPLVIDPFQQDSYLQINDMILNIIASRKKADVEFWINITGGTNLMSAAAATSAILSKANAYYVNKVDESREEQDTIIRLPSHTFDISKLTDKDRRILRLIMDDKDHPNEFTARERDLINNNKDLTPKKIRYPIDKLERLGYLEKYKQGTVNIIKLRPSGILAIRLFSL